MFQLSFFMTRYILITACHILVVFVGPSSSIFQGKVCLFAASKFKIYECLSMCYLFECNWYKWTFQIQKSTSRSSLRIFIHTLIWLTSLLSNFDIFPMYFVNGKNSCWNKKAATIKVICLTASKGFTLIKSMYREQYIQTSIFHSRLQR